MKGERASPLREDEVDLVRASCGLTGFAASGRRAMRFGAGEGEGGEMEMFAGPSS